MALRLSRHCSLVFFRMPKERELPYPLLQSGLPEYRARAKEVVADSQRKWRQVARFPRPSPPHVPLSSLMIGELRFVRGRMARSACAAGLCLRVRGGPVSALDRARCWVLGILLFVGSPTGSVAERAMWSLRVACRNAALCLDGRRGVLPAFPLFSYLGQAVGCREARGGCCRCVPASW